MTEYEVFFKDDRSLLLSYMQVWRLFKSSLPQRKLAVRQFLASSQPGSCVFIKGACVTIERIR